VAGVFHIVGFEVENGRCETSRGAGVFHIVGFEVEDGPEKG
jgi:hypothetical protein